MMWIKYKAKYGEKTWHYYDLNMEEDAGTFALERAAQEFISEIADTPEWYNTRIEYEIIKYPPKEDLIRIINSKKSEIKYLERDIKEYEQIVKLYPFT